MKITIFGAGYVGLVSAVCLTRDGHHVTFVEPVESKVEDLLRGKSPIREPKIPELLASAHQKGLLHATCDPAEGVASCDMVWVCVGTPSQSDGSVTLDIVESATRQIGKALSSLSMHPLVVIRSTIAPGSMNDTIIPLLDETSGAKPPVVFHPEFLREGCAVDDFDHPPKIVVGERNRGDGEPLLSVYEKIDAPRFRLELAEAEWVKYYDNLFHAVKITFANEVGALARLNGVDARRVAKVFCADKKLNISPTYLRPGFAFGGSCLPKDTRAIVRLATVQSVSVPMLENMLVSNEKQIDTLVHRILAYRPQSVGMVGLAFKPDTDDMRESPFVTVAKRLLGEGISLNIFDPNVETDRLIGSNREAVQRALAHLEELLVKSITDLDTCDIVLVNHATINSEQIREWTSKNIRVIDLASIPGVDRSDPLYEGIAW